MDECAARGLPHVPVEPIRTEDWPTRAVRPRNSVLDSGKFERTFGFTMPDWRSSTGAVVERLAQAQGI
jgi:dTDP-4-dehydrorhamnose reductase